MEESLNGCMVDFVDSEKLKSFSVEEKFCEQCGDLTPHHIEDSKEPLNVDRDAASKVFVAPLSTHECIICRDDEETWIEEFDS